MPTLKMMKDEDNEAHTEGSKGLSGALTLQFPPDSLIWAEARKLVADTKVRVEDLATCCLQDPILVIELLKQANALYFSGGRPPITSTTTAIIRLGSQVVRELLEGLLDRPQFENEEVLHWVNVHRSRMKRTAIISRILAEALAKQLSDDCQAAGLLVGMGELLAIGFFQEKYVELAEELSRSGINYRLAQESKFDVERMGLLYLRRHGIPEALLFALDRDAMNRAPERAIMKPLVSSAAEMVDAFDNNKWERLAPGKTLSSKSNIRLLQMTDNQYLKVYERTSEYLYQVRMLEEKKKSDALREQMMSTLESQNIPSLEDEIFSLLADTTIVTTEADFPAAPSPSNKPSLVVPPQMSGNRGNKIVGAIFDSINSVQSSEELLSSLLSMLLQDGLFEKSALIVVSPDKRKAKVVAARGPVVEKGLSLDITDPLSPLAQCFTKVQSFGSKQSVHSPFGSKSFAVSPIEASHDSPVALYADCGNNGSVSFEARRVFRAVVDLLNQKLPDLPGGIPEEG